MDKIIKWVKRIGIFIAGVGGFFLALYLMGTGGKKRLSKADAKIKRAQDLRTKADLIEAHIAELKAQSAMTDEEIEAERKGIESLETLEEIEDAFTKLGY